jgi:serine protease
VELLRLSLPNQALHGEGKGNKPLPGEEGSEALKELTLDRIRRLREDPNVEYAEPNFIRKPLLTTPDDQWFELQWHYSLINLPEAWDITTGSDEITVAVLDSGILSDHPDLRARLTDGYDFISDSENANDGDGWDPDPEDPGDDPEGENSSFHGTHVAGTVGAVTNNNIGVAGVTWQTRIMPLRVLGVDGGTDADISEAIRYAVGLENDTLKVAAEPAHIVNMSFGAPGFSETVQNAVLDARAAGAILVAAAGNERTGLDYFPASSEGVISVSAVDLNLQRASYSNFGPTIDVAAPGGDTGDGVLSTLGNDNGEFSYVFYHGTSMAAPHVAGVVALMLAANPKLDPKDIDHLLAGTHPDTTIRITHDLGRPGRDDIYGHGLIDAAQAVVAAQAIPGGGGPDPSGSILAVSTSLLNFRNFLDELSFKVTNAGIETLRVTDITDIPPWLALSPTSGTAPLTVEATVDRTGLAEGEHKATIQVTTDATQGVRTAAIIVEMEVGGKTLGDVGNVFVLVLDPESSETVVQTETDASQAYAFTTPPLKPGRYQVYAGTDLDYDGDICDIEDACGSNPELVTVVSGQNTPGIDFLLTTFASPQGIPSSPLGSETVWFGRLR